MNRQLYNKLIVLRLLSLSETQPTVVRVVALCPVCAAVAEDNKVIETVRKSKLVNILERSDKNLVT